MAGMKGEVANLSRPQEEYDAAVDRAIALGHGGAPQVAKETGIPVDTLRRKIQDHKKQQASEPSSITIPPLPNTNVFEEMAQRAISALWTHTCRLTDPTAIANGMKINVKELGDTADSAKKWEAVGKTKTTQPKASALQGLTNTESGSLAA